MMGFGSVPGSGPGKTDPSTMRLVDVTGVSAMRPATIPRYSPPASRAAA
jgi:hypothetical protein